MFKPSSDHEQVLPFLSGLIRASRLFTQQIFLDVDCTSCRFRCCGYRCKQNKAPVFTEFIFLTGGEGDRHKHRGKMVVG